MMTVARRLAVFLGDKSILVVEPSSNYKTSIKQYLQNLKMIKNVKTVATAGEARRELLTTKVGMMIVEWALADQNGIQLCRSLRKDPLTRDAIFLLLTVENQRKDVVLASEASIDGYLIKPFSYEEFVKQVDLQLSKRETPSPVALMLDSADRLFDAGDLDGAFSGFDSVRQVKPKSARALVGLGRVSEKRNLTDEASVFYMEAIQANPDYLEAYRALINLYAATGNFGSLLKTALMAHSRSPDNPRYILMVAQAYLEMQEPKNAEIYFRKAIRVSPKLAEAYKGLGDVFIAQEDYEEAMSFYGKALDIDSEDISTLNSMGMALVRQAQVPEGIKKYRMALAVAPKDSRILFNLGYAYERQNDTERAEYYYQQAVQNDPAMTKAREALERVKNANMKK
jgi:tetratricopeptide (TPR) repeat protein